MYPGLEPKWALAQIHENAGPWNENFATVDSFLDKYILKQK